MPDSHLNIYLSFEVTCRHAWYILFSSIFLEGDYHIGNVITTEVFFDVNNTFVDLLMTLECLSSSHPYMQDVVSR